MNEADMHYEQVCEIRRAWPRWSSSYFVVYDCRTDIEHSEVH